MRYVPACAPELLPDEQLQESDLGSWLAAVPTVRFDSADALPGMFAQMFGTPDHALRAHLVPSNREYLDAVRAGLGWSVLPEDQVIGDLRTGALVQLPTQVTVDIPLYWHRWRLESTFLDALDAEVRRCAERALHQPPPAT